ncbi:MAG TPA: RagB/SusD family nutrient uptake outer membrane protein [Cytophagales bacterium]|nr:RagB/SusD family nutrient uptake outer membrane protein [Cytophagales bacterium]
MKLKVYTYALPLVAVLGLASCSVDPLDLQPLSDIGGNGFYANSDEVESGVIAIYDGLQQLPLREFALTEMRSDNTRTKSSEGDWAQFQDYNVAPTNVVIGSYWADNYNVIFRANVVLANLDVVEDANAAAQFEGEAKFARALAHFNLVRAYGDVPMVDRVIIQSDTDYFDRDPVATVMSLIEADLTDAASMLPDASDMAFGRATQGAAQALLAKVHLTNSNYSAAQSLLETVINSGNYALEDDYSDVFYSEGNDEIIFAIPYLDDDAVESQDFSFEMTAGGQASGLNYLTDDFKAFMDVEDIERAAALVNPLDANETGKFISASSDVRLCGNDWIVLRLADVYLMHAEAVLAGANTTTDAGAITSYNATRERAGVTALATDGSETLTKTMLMNERRVELAFENHRLYDLIRMGVATDVLGAFATAEGHAFTATDLLLPIPQAEINVSGGALTQNPGY